MGFDIAVLKVKDSALEPLLLAKETTPSLEVLLWGFTNGSIDKFPLGKEFSGKLYTTKTLYKSEPEDVDLQESWNNRPPVNVAAYQINCKTAGKGLSGAPVFEPI